MKKWQKILLILGVLLLIFVFANILSIKRNTYEGIESSREIGLPAPSVLEEKTLDSEEAKTTQNSRVVIKSGELNLVVSNVEDSAKQIIQYVEKLGGWVVSSEILKVNEIPVGKITVRVPAGKFDTAMGYFSSFAVKVENEKREGEDVTEEYIDLKSRLRNLEATEKQLLKIMQKANKISDVLAVHKEITNTREEIEEIKGKIIYIQRSAKMSTITVNLSLSEELLPVPSGERWKPQYVAKQAWKGVVIFWRNVAYLLIKIAVYALVWIPIAIILWLIWRLKRKKICHKDKKRK